MLAGLIFANVALTANLAVAQGPPQEGEHPIPARLSAMPPDSPAPNHREVAQPDPFGTIAKPDSAFSEAGKQFFSDQKAIWISPAKLRWQDAEWIIPIAGITTGMIFTDPSLSHSLSHNPGTLHLYNDVRNASVSALGAAAGGLYLFSLHSHDPHQREAGFLTVEAIADSMVLTEGIKFVAGRQRPLQTNGQGDFFQGGNSFPSSHSAAAWSAAGILAHEYPGTMTKFLAYGLAAAVSFASVGSREHFSSDVFIGSGLGWLVSEYVYRAHHRAELGGNSWSPLHTVIHDEESEPAQYRGSAYVPLDSWVYPAFDRLAALGYVSAGFQGTRPWSREKCLQLLQEVEDRVTSVPGSNASLDLQTSALLVGLQREFAREKETSASANVSMELDSVYSRVLSASGTVLDDGFHFGQTHAYDIGRPFRRGTNFISGASGSATYGSLFFYVSGEYQHSAAAPALTPAEIQFIATADKVSPPAASPFPAINQFQLLEAYAGMNLHNWQLSFGNQSLSWGPGTGGSLLLSDNAAPFPMLRISPGSPVEIPGLSKILGPFNIEQFYGRIEGHPGASQPWIYGQKISFKPLHSLEFAYGRTTLIGGTGHPLTSELFFQSFFGRVNSQENSVPGDSRTSVEWTWRLPELHDWVTFYGELEDDDDLIPLQNVAKSVWRPGIYFPRLPFLPKSDLHLEWTSSTSPGRATFQNHGNLNYWNLDYTSGYTNNGNLMGNTVGREGVTLQAWTRFWIAPRHTLDLSWKQSRVLDDFVPGGGKWQDVQAGYSFTSHSGVFVKSVLQFEHISSFPLLFRGARNNIVASIELGFLPPWGRHHTAALTTRESGDNPAGVEAPR